MKANNDTSKPPSRLSCSEFKAELISVYLHNSTAAQSRFPPPLAKRKSSFDSSSIVRISWTYPAYLNGDNS